MVEDGSHSIDQPEGKTLDQVKLVFGSSLGIPKNKSQVSLSMLILSKTYPTKGIYSSPISRHARLEKVLSFLLLKNQKECVLNFTF